MCRKTKFRDNWILRVSDALTNKKNRCGLAEKKRETNSSLVLASVDQPRMAARQSARSGMRACINPKCVSFGRIVYSVATRCPLCKWDLKFTLPASETSASTKAASAAATR